MINFEIENELKNILSKDERLVWTGKPQTGIKFRNSDLYLIPFSIMWGGFSIFWESTVIATNAPLLFKLWGIPFVLIGLYIMIGRFFLDARKRANTIYGITSDRIIIKSGIFVKDINSINLRTLTNITMNQKSDNSGTIFLGPVDPKSSMMQGIEWPGIKQTPSLDFIEDVKTVYDKIVQLQNK